MPCMTVQTIGAEPDVELSTQCGQQLVCEFAGSAFAGAPSLSQDSFWSAQAAFHDHTMPLPSPTATPPASTSGRKALTILAMQIPCMPIAKCINRWNS